MNTVTLLGFVAAVLTTFAYLPQAIRIIKTKNTNSISLGMYVAMVIGVILWLIYGIALNEPPIYLANAITLLLSGTILFYKIKHG